MRLIYTLIASLLVSTAHAQSVQQSGVITPGHAACWAITGVIFDCGAPGGGVSVVGSTTTNDLVAFNASGSLIDSGINPTSTSAISGLWNFNGGATAPTRPANDNSTNVATTAFVQGVFATNTNPFLLPQSFIGNNVNPIAADGAQVTVQNSSTTQENVFNPLTGGVVYDGLRSTVYVPPSSTALSGNAFGCYIRSRAGTGVNFGAGVCYYGLVTAGASNSNVWFINGRMEDSEDGAGHSYTGVNLIYNEADFEVTSALTSINGYNMQIASTVAFAGGAGFQVTNRTPAFGQLTASFISGDAAAPIGLIIGAPAATGTSLSSQTIKFNRFDSGGVEHAEFLSDDAAGTLTWSGGAGLALLGAASTNTLVGFWEGGAQLWQVGALSNHHFFAFDQVAGAFVWQMTTGGTFALTPPVSMAAALTYGGVTLSNAVTGTGNMVLGTSPTITSPTLASLTTFSGQFISTFGATSIASGACGATTNGTVAGTNASGLITIGAAATTTCTVSFSTTITAPGACVIFPANGTAAAQGTTLARVSSVGTTNFVITGNANVLASSNYYYICL